MADELVEIPTDFSQQVLQEGGKLSENQSECVASNPEDNTDSSSSSDESTVNDHNSEQFSDDEADEFKEFQKQRRWYTKPVRFVLLTIHSIGVVYGDLGTSPIYTYPTIISDLGNYTTDDLYGVTCLMMYSLIITVCIKYLVIVMCADNKGEGGILALVSLIPPNRGSRKRNVRPGFGARWMKRICLFGAFLGAAFILSDGAITPAIEVLSAVEGLGIVNQDVVSYQVPISLFFLVCLFVSQSFGSTKLGWCFGPIMILYQISIAAIGLYNIILYDPGVWRCFNPSYGFWFVVNNPYTAFVSLGGVVLALTGVEALYADMGHFGKWPIRVGWFLCVYPSVVLSYLGQVVYMVEFPDSNSNSFFLSIPNSLLGPMVALCIAATIIASQSLITSVFSLVSQAMALDAFPTMKVKHTDASFHGQVYIAPACYIHMTATLALVLFFQSSTALAYAFAIAMTGTIAITTLIFMALMMTKWWWTFWFVIPIGLFFWGIEMLYFTSNLLKFTSGGWVPLLFATILTIIMCSWAIARHDLRKQGKVKGYNMTTEEILDWVGSDGNRSDSTAVFLQSNNEWVPNSLRAFKKISATLPKTIVLLSTRGYDVPYLRQDSHISGFHLGNEVYSVIVRHGFFEHRMKLDEVLQEAEQQHILPPSKITQAKRTHYYLCRATVRLHQKRQFWFRVLYSIYNTCAHVAANPVFRHIQPPRKRLVEFFSVQGIQKIMPGNNYFSRFWNRRSGFKFGSLLQSILQCVKDWVSKLRNKK